MDEKLKSRRVQEIFGIAKSTLHNWKQQGILNPVRIGGLDYYDRAEVDQLLLNGCEGKDEVVFDPDKGRRI